MSPFKYLFFAVSLFILSITWYLSNTNRKIATAFGVEEPLKCDTTEIGQFAVFDFAVFLRQQLNIKFIPEQTFFIFREDSTRSIEGEFNKKTGQITNFGSITLSQSDSISLFAVFQKTNNLYERWAKYLGPVRNKFLDNRNQTLTTLRAENKAFSFKIIDDVRKLDRQMLVLNNGKSAAALSLHQFGLASDFGIFKGKTYLKSGKIYQKIGEEAARNYLTWGGNFKGLAGDFGHVQLFRNSAEMLTNLPELRLEYEQYRKFYSDRIDKFEKEGKGALVEDSKELLQVLDLLVDGKICGCELKIDSLEAQKITNNLPAKFKNFKPKKDFLVYVDYPKKLAYLLDSTNSLKKFKLGAWK